MFFFFKQKTAYEMRISDWSSDVCSSDLGGCLYASLLSMSSTTTGADSVVKRAAAKLDVVAGLTTVSVRIPGMSGNSTSSVFRSEERRGGKECVSTCRSRWSP